MSMDEYIMLGFTNDEIQDILILENNIKDQIDNAEESIAEIVKRTFNIFINDIKNKKFTSEEIKLINMLAYDHNGKYITTKISLFKDYYYYDNKTKGNFNSSWNEVADRSLVRELEKKKKKKEKAQLLLIEKENERINLERLLPLREEIERYRQNIKDEISVGIPPSKKQKEFIDNYDTSDTFKFLSWYNVWRNNK